MSNYRTEYEYNEKTGKSYFYIEHNGITMCGEAKCHPDDTDMMSERTGLTIAEARAQIKVMKFKRNFELKPKIAAITHLLNTMERSTKYNENSYESKMIRRQLHTLKKQLTTINNDIAEEEKYLNEYITQKEKLYQKLRGRNK